MWFQKFTFLFTFTHRQQPFTSSWHHKEENFEVLFLRSQGKCVFSHDFIVIPPLSFTPLPIPPAAIFHFGSPKATTSSSPTAHRPPPLLLPSTLITLLLHPLLLGHSDFTVRGCSVPPVWSCRDLIQRTQPFKTAFIVLFVSPCRPGIYFQSKLQCFNCTSWFSLVSTFWCLLGLCKEWDHVCINASCFDSYLPFGFPLVFPLCPKPLARLTVSSC